VDIIKTISPIIIVIASIIGASYITGRAIQQARQSQESVLVAMSENNQALIEQTKIYHKSITEISHPQYMVDKSEPMEREGAQDHIALEDLDDKTFRTIIAKNEVG